MPFLLTIKLTGPIYCYKQSYKEYLVNLFLSHEARLNKTSVSGPADGNCGQSGGGHFFFLLIFFLVWYEYFVIFLRKKIGGQKWKKKFPVLTHPAAGPETEVFLVWPKNVAKKDTNWVKTGIVEVAIVQFIIVVTSCQMRLEFRDKVKCLLCVQNHECPIWIRWDWGRNTIQVYVLNT